MSGPLPKVLYKSLLAKYARSMVEEGSVQVGTLCFYRKLEDDKERHDADEGRLSLHSDRGSRVYNCTEDLPPVLQAMSIDCGIGGIHTHGESAIRLDSDGPNMLVYCMHDALDERLRRDFGEACVVIREPTRFINAVDAALRNELERFGRSIGPPQIGRCRYIDRKHNWHDELPPYWLLKPLCFAHQNEVRAAWAVNDPAHLEPLLVSSPEIAATVSKM